MLKQTGNQIVAALDANTTLISLLAEGVNSIYPVIAEEDTELPFLTYLLKYNGQRSKDNASEYSLYINVVSKGYDEAIEIAEEVYNALDIDDFIGSLEEEIPGYQEKTDMIEVKQVYNIQKIN